MRQLALGILMVAASLANAEIVLPEEGDFTYSHPSFRSLVFVSPTSLHLSINPPPPYFVAPPPLLMRAPTPMPLYAPAMAPSFNQPARPSNRDNANYLLQKAHGFSQNLYREESPVLTLTPESTWLWLGATHYPPAQPAGFNQPARPGNRDNAGYLMDRAHRFSMDAYKQQ